jgi:adenosylcobinamide kinase/adenosylcobinamide-phosphate guanylyltransferase
MNLYLITGGAGCGKSAFAEFFCGKRFDKDGGRKLYLATMANDGSPETSAKINRHRRLRAGRGFLTVERPRNLGQAAGLIYPGDQILLEDLGNLAANEMFGKNPRDRDEILAGLLTLAGAAGKTGSLIVVSNEVALDGCSFAPETEQYIRLLTALNRELARRASAAVRLVAGIPVILTGEEELEKCVR